MTLPRPIAPSQTDAKSPVNDNLADSIRENLNYLDDQVTGGATFLQWVIGESLRSLSRKKHAIDAAPAPSQFTPGICRVTLGQSGLRGAIKFDIRKIRQTKTPIVGIDFQYDQITQSVGNVTTGLTTQSITRAASQISTQSISLVKATISIQSIVQVSGTNRWRLNLDATPDADWLIGKHILISGATDSGNNGTFEIKEVNQSGYPSIVVENALGAAQDLPSGSVQLQLFAYNQVNPVDARFAPGESALFAGHTAPANNGTLEIHRVNSGGNNILVFNSTGATQGAASGTVDTQRLKYNFSSPADPAVLVVGENAKLASHTNGLNNGNLPIRAVNDGGNNVVIYNPLGVVQAGIAGSVGTNRWTYLLPTDPASQISVGDFVQLEGHTSGNNDGVFKVVVVRYEGNSNIVIYNELGAVQGGTGGRVRTVRKVIKFQSDQSLVYSTDSFITIENVPDGLYRDVKNRTPFKVLEVNRGGGANYNVVIEVPRGRNQPLPAGFVSTEMKSIFLSPPTINPDLTGLYPNKGCVYQFTNFVPGFVLAGTMLGLFFTEMQLGSPQNMTVVLQ